MLSIASKIEESVSDRARLGLHGEVTNFSNPPAEKRAHKRFIVSGRTKLETASGPISGEVVTIGAGGLLVRIQTQAPVGTEVAIDLAVSVSGGQFLLAGQGRVVWSRAGEMGIKFLDDSPGLSRLLIWLEREHCPWSSIA